MALMQNYFSVGVDAEVSRRFDAARSARPEAFRSQMSNKLKYGAARVPCVRPSMPASITSLAAD